MTLSDSLEAQARREVDGARCFCKHSKRRAEPFCRDCYQQLPADQRYHLHKTFSEDFASRYDEAKDWLRLNA